MHRMYHICLNKGEEDANPLESFLITLKSYAKTFSDTSDIYVAWDRRLIKDKTNYRYQLTEGEYKGGRDKSHQENIDGIEVQLYPILNSLGVKQFFPRKMEADDILAFLNITLQGEKVVITSDKDLLQLIGPETSYYNALKKIVINEFNFEEINGVELKDFVLYKSIMGDKSDNVDGLMGYGPKKSAKACKDYPKSIQNPELIKIIERNLKIFDLSDGFEREEYERDFYQEQLDTQLGIQADIKRFKKLCTEKELTKILISISSWKEIFFPNETLESKLGKLGKLFS